jgi:ABC-type Mn2+/Zn2+ transport system permease subunit
VVTGIVVAMGFAMLALAFTRTAKPSGISIEELDYLYGVITLLNFRDFLVIIASPLSIVFAIAMFVEKLVIVLKS